LHSPANSFSAHSPTQSNKDDANRADRIVAGFSGYLIIAFLWAALYSTHKRMPPGGWSIPRML
jgi:hypothetical protein